MGLTGEIKVGDAVKTLNRTRAIYGRVGLVDRRKKVAVVEGRTQPGAVKRTFTSSLEDLELISDAELCPEDRRPVMHLLYPREPPRGWAMTNAKVACGAVLGQARVVNMKSNEYVECSYCDKCLNTKEPDGQQFEALIVLEQEET